MSTTHSRMEGPADPVSPAGGRLATLGLSVPVGTVAVVFFGPLPALTVIFAVTLLCWWRWRLPTAARRGRAARPPRPAIASAEPRPGAAAAVTAGPTDG